MAIGFIIRPVAPAIEGATRRALCAGCAWYAEGHATARRSGDSAVCERRAHLLVGEIGCGTGHYARALAPITTSYIALDISEAMLEAAKRHCAGTTNITYLHADAQAMPLADDAVDLVFGTWAIGAIWPPEARERAMDEGLEHACTAEQDRLTALLPGARHVIASLSW